MFINQNRCITEKQQSLLALPEIRIGKGIHQFSILLSKENFTHNIHSIIQNSTKTSLQILINLTPQYNNYFVIRLHLFCYLALSKS